MAPIDRECSNGNGAKAPEPPPPPAAPGAHAAPAGSAIMNGNNGGCSKRRPIATQQQRVVDLRSDTVTKPTPEMRAAMAAAEVDDDVLGEDPTARRLQAEVAATLGKQAALLVPSGTMANLIAVLVHCEVRGSAALLGSRSHILLHEQGGVAALGGVYPRAVRNLGDGTLDLADLEAAMDEAGGGNDDDKQLAGLLHATPRLVCLENSHAGCGGRAVPAAHAHAVAALARARGLAVHLDGARLFNAAAALRTTPAALAAPADSVCVCLSKGMAAPAGSVLAGSHAFVAKARRLRKALGGGMRQVGVLAAAALVGLRNMAGRLGDDHRRARMLAHGLAAVPGLRVPGPVDTNIVCVEVEGGRDGAAAALCRAVEARGVLVMHLGGVRDAGFRLVTHYHISDEDVVFAVACFRDACSSTSSRTPTPAAAVAATPAAAAAGTMVVA